MNWSYRSAHIPAVPDIHCKHLFKYSFIVVMTLSWFFLMGPVMGYTETGVCPAGGGSVSDAEPSSAAKMPDDLLALKIYRVENGKMGTRVFDGDSLKQSGSLSISGYVSGIVAVGKPGLDIRVDGKSMSPVRQEANGEFSLGYYGTINPAQLVKSNPIGNSDLLVTESAVLTQNSRSRSDCPEVYSFFPSVPGDTVCSKSNFRVEISTGDAAYRLGISHSGGIDTQACASEGVCGFRYIGLQKTDLDHALADSDDRLQAISDGVAAVESAFHTDLVKTVHVIAYDDIRNAVTCLNQNDIWFYINTFKDEPVNELAVIAEHEALHILVDKLNLTANSDVRKMFADLKGFNDFSIERFQIVSRGHTPSKVRLDKGEDGFFFEFISERNFLNGMKGGHPQENLDEFCASFLHTLMYPDRFEANLTHPLPASGGASMIPDIQERENIISRYIGLLKIVRSLLVTDTAISGTDFQTVSDRFFLQHLNMLENLSQTVAEASASRQ